jgi:hypothetical protein
VFVNGGGICAVSQAATGHKGPLLTTFSCLISHCLTAFDATVSCPEDYSYMFDGCYRYSNVTLSWIHSTIAAAKESATLATIHSVPNNRWMAEHLRARHQFEYEFWIGLNDIAEEGEWVNSDGSDASFTMWAMNNPSTDITTNCVSYGTNMQWINGPCFYPKRALFKYNETAVAPTEGKHLSPVLVLLPCVSYRLFIVYPPAHTHRTACCLPLHSLRRSLRLPRRLLLHV